MGSHGFVIPDFLHSVEFDFVFKVSLLLNKECPVSKLECIEGV